MTPQGHGIVGKNDKYSVALLMPQPDPERNQAGLTKGRTWGTPLGLVMLASYLEENSGFQFTPAKAYISSEELTGLVGGCSKVGLSTLPNNYRESIRQAKAIKGTTPTTEIILGGPYASSRAGQIIACQQSVDYVVVGAGEIASELFNSGSEMSAIPNLYYRDTDGKTCFTGHEYLPLQKRPIPNRQLWPFAGVDFQGRQGTVVYWEDGCPLALGGSPCVFCTITHLGLSRRTVEQVISEMKQLSTIGFGAIEDGSPSFADSGPDTRKWLNQLAEAIQAEGMDFRWIIHTTTHSLVEQGMIDVLGRLGVAMVQIGYESGDLRFKPVKTTLDQERVVQERLKDAGMSLFASFIVGHPGEDRRSLEQTRQQVFDLHASGLLKGVEVDRLWPGPGSKAFAMLCEYYPELKSRDYVSPEELMGLWYPAFTHISLEDVLSFCQDVITTISHDMEVVVSFS